MAERTLRNAGGLKQRLVDQVLEPYVYRLGSDPQPGSKRGDYHYRTGGGLAAVCVRPDQRFLRDGAPCGAEYSDRPATANFMYFFKSIDYHRLQKEIDIVSWDNYPCWHKKKDEVPVAVQAALNHSQMRSLKKEPFLLMESTPSQVSWRTCNPLKRPGMHMLSSMQAVAHGSDSVLYFQWRKGRGAFEKFHGAVVDHKNGSNTPHLPGSDGDRKEDWKG